MLLFTHDFQPFSVVEDYGFKKFVANLNPSYELPSRKTISNTLLPAIFEQTVYDTREDLSEAKAVTLTTDCWTSRNNESFMAITAHFINNCFELQNKLLDCSTLDKSHTSENLANEIQRVIQEWNLETKVIMVISDNAANIKKAVKDGLNLPPFWVLRSYNQPYCSKLSNASKRFIG